MSGAELLHKPGISLSQFIKGADLADVLDIITHVYTFLKHDRDQLRKYNTSIAARGWRNFVLSLFETEAVGYKVDEECGVRYKVDEEFQHVREAAVSSLGSPAYSAVHYGFEAAYKALETELSDTKLAVRHMFEAVETLFKRVAGSKAKRLGSREVKDLLLPTIDELYGADRMAANTTRKLLSGLAERADGLHAYRHGQTEPSPPSMEAAVAALQTGSAYIRLLIELERKKLNL
jgi:hypothetical protein